MDAAWGGGLTGYEPVSEVDRKEFLDQGWLLVRNALDEDHRRRLEEAVDRVLADLGQTGPGATKIIPGSHLWNSLPRPADLSVHNPDPAGTVEITANPGDAFIFDRRLWHSRSTNLSAVTRKMLFVGYTYRWIRTLDTLDFDPQGEWYQNR